MQRKLWSLLVTVSVACGQVAAEPIQAGESSLSITGSGVEDVDSDDVYACEVVETAPRGTPDPEIAGFIGLPPLPDYGGRCKQARMGALTQCEYLQGPGGNCLPGENHRGDPQSPCGGAVGKNYDTEAGTFTLEAVQYMVCHYPCVTNDECPAPGSGTARGLCLHDPNYSDEYANSYCQLACEDGETCPEGFVCIPGPRFGLSDGTFRQYPAQCAQPHTVVIEANID